MANSWDNYFSHYSDWDDAHCFNVRLELKFEENIKSLGYVENVSSDDLFIIDNSFSNQALPQSQTYIKSKNEISLSFDVPYDWSIDTDWEDKALVLLGLNDEWVIDSSVEDK
ncbi:hypothetical protein [Prochlorococcus marinus]|uniref:Uncharacterized protein n=1 Tax=Prochlorococcus marinus XMU1408 TaxID=2213228 RepID=A0A318R4U1_PROMR|nr:hypothetical protein [Prochlorococcus marinus]MBW3041722.1 hypothetical protein [Prochlorococcus marinus str. XMU1408]PYE02868.1 hypothetical protein DNJ73_03730 [Prochlorococcus marinus XMU1408]